MSYPFEAFDLNPEQIRSPKREIKRTGNRCGHQPSAPRLIIKSNPYVGERGWEKAGQLDDLGHKRKSAWFYEVAEKLNQFYQFPRLLPALGLIYKDMTTRKHRSEAREADAALMTALTHHVELASVNWKEGFCRVGMPTQGGFVYFDNKYWCKVTGLTPSRLKRSFARLAKVGFIKRERRWTEREGGRFKGLATMTLIYLGFYHALGLLDGLKDAAHFAYQNLKKAADAMQSSVSRMLSCVVERAKTVTKQNKNKLKPSEFPADNPKHWEAQLDATQVTAFRHRYLKLIMQQGSGCQPEAIYREAYQSIVSA
jgi:hypothetical protein